MKKKIWNALDVLNWGREYFEKKRIESARLNVELLICKALGWERIDIYANFDKPLKKKELEAIKSLMKRRLAGEPVDYIVGAKNFFGLTFNLAPAALIPRPETEGLVDLVISDVEDKSAELRILDIGCGSGCIAAALGKNLPNSHVLSVDSSDSALKLARKNLELNDIKNVELARLDILKTSPKGDFDAIVSNPPYIPTREYEALEKEVREFEPRIALDGGKDGLIFFRRFAEIFPKTLAKNGKFYLEIGFGQAKDVREIFEGAGFDVEIILDFARIDRYACGLTENSPKFNEKNKKNR